MLPANQPEIIDLTIKVNDSRPTIWPPATLTNLVTFTPSSVYMSSQSSQKAGPHITHYTGRIVDEIIEEMFNERKGYFPETSSACPIDEPQRTQSSQRVDKRLQYWRDILENRHRLQRHIQAQTGKSPSEVLLNRSSTYDHRNKQTMLRLLDYADRLRPESLMVREPQQLKDLIDPCSCNHLATILETLPLAERKGSTRVEVVGIPTTIQEELLGEKIINSALSHSWMESQVLDKRIDHRFKDISEVLEFFPDLDALQVTGSKIPHLRECDKAILLNEELNPQISSTDQSTCSEEQMLELSEAQSIPVIPEIGIRVNGKDYIVGDGDIMECYQILSKFKCDPFQHHLRNILHLTNIGRQTLSFNWQQGIYYYNKPTLLLAKDNEFLFDMESFRLAHGESYKLAVLYQPRRVGTTVELWRLHIDPKIFCANQESILLRFHGSCTAPAEYMSRLHELNYSMMHNANKDEMFKLLHHQASLVPLIESPSTCCPYERALNDREVFNSLNPGYRCDRFDDLEVLRAMHKHVKKPREPQWDLRLDTIKKYILRIENAEQRKRIFADFMVVLEPLLGNAVGLDTAPSDLGSQKQRTRLVYVRGVICNGIEEWQQLMYTIAQSFYKSELQYFHVKLKHEEDDEDVKEELGNTTAKLMMEKTPPADGTDICTAEVARKLQHSKFFRDALYMQTYALLCDITENIVSVIESTEDSPQ